MVPIIGRLSSVQHLAEHPIGVITVFVGPLGVFVIHPGVEDHSARGVVAEEEPVLLEELSAEPMLVTLAQGLALPILGSGGITRNHLEGEFDNRRQPLGRIFSSETDRVLVLEPSYLLAKGL